MLHTRKMLCNPPLKLFHLFDSIGLHGVRVPRRDFDLDRKIRELLSINWQANQILLL